MKLSTSIYKDFLALVAGCLLTLAFAPFNIFPFAIFSTTILLGLWLNTSKKRAFWLGWLYGLGLFGTGVYWIFISVYNFGTPSFLFSLIITGGFIAILALFPALVGYFLNRFFPHTNDAKLLLAFPVIWVLSEWVRSWIYSGFPWLLVGYSQIDSPLRGYAPIFSVYGVSLTVLLSSGLLVSAIIKARSAEYRKLSITLLRLILIWLIGFYLSLMAWTTPSAEPIKVSLVQGNIPQEVKWSPTHVQPTLDRYVELTKPHWDSKIIVWPESAIPIPLHLTTDFLENINAKALEHKTTLITGIPIKSLKKNEDGYYNAIIALGEGKGAYAKHHLVPFGEFVPLRNIFGKFLDLLQVPMSNFIPGNGIAKPILAGSLKIATFICYEIAYPEQVRTHDDIDLLLTISNDAWFGRSIAQAQHLEIAQMRALEMGRPILFVGNDGITAIINANGKVQSSAPQFESFVLTDKVRTTRGKTPWQKYSMDPILGTLLLMLIIAIRNRKKFS